jgi:apolipoprotein N-acyltransferase
MLFALTDDRPRVNLGLAVVYGTVAVGTIFRWIVDTIALFSNIPLPGALGILLLFALVFGTPYWAAWPLAPVLRRRLGAAWVLVWPAVWVLLEWTSSFLLLFPYQQGVAQYTNPAILQLASVTGVYGITYLVLAFNAAVAEGFWAYRQGRGARALLAPALGALAVATVASWGAWRFNALEATLRAAPTGRVTLLQSSRDMVWRLRHSMREAWAEWLHLTLSIPPGSTDLVIWPEGACPYDLNDGRAAEALAEISQQRGFELLVGGGTRLREVDPEMGETEVRVFNSVYHFTPEGGVAGHYDKMVPLPFGEYMPLAETAPWLVSWIEGPSDFRAGKDAVLFQTRLGRAAAPICYEAILPEVCRRFDAPDLMVNVTNDAWFGDSAATWQHGMLAMLRAVELGIPLVRSAYTGTSFVAEPHGHVYARTQPFEDVVMHVPIRKAKVATIYAAWGDWFVGLCAAVAAVAWAARRR